MRRFVTALAAIGALFAAAPLLAHHAIQAQFDTEKEVLLTGVLSKMEWINPHAYMHLDVTDEAGKVTTWSLETSGPQGLRKAGLSRTSRNGLKVGDKLLVRGLPAKNGSSSAFIRNLTLPDGRLITIWYGDPNAR